MTVRIYLAGERVGSQLRSRAKVQVGRINKAQRGAAQDVVAYVEPRARASIRRGGRFGARFTESFRGKVTQGGGNVRVEFFMAPFYWRVFEFGATIRGDPLLWIPLSFAKDAQGKRARDYPGQLFRVDRPGKAPLLMAKSGSGPAQAKYFGKASVKIPKKWALRVVIREGAQKQVEFYRRRMSASGSS